MDHWRLSLLEMLRNATWWQIGIGSADETTLNPCLEAAPNPKYQVSMCFFQWDADLLNAVDAPLIGLRDEQGAQVRQGDGLRSLQRGTNCCSAHQVVVDPWDLAVDGAACYNTHLKTF